jgi:TldD protein
LNPGRHRPDIEALRFKDEELTMYELARSQLLEPSGLEQNDIEQALGRLTRGSIDLGELYFQRRVREGWMLEDGSVKSGSWDVDQGVGVRAIAGAGTGFAYADAISLPALLDAADSARAIGRSGQAGRVQVGARAHRAGALHQR